MPVSIIDGGREAVVYLGYQVGVHFQSLTGNPSPEILGMVRVKHETAAIPSMLIVEMPEEVTKLAM